MHILVTEKYLCHFLLGLYNQTPVSNYLSLFIILYSYIQYYTTRYSMKILSNTKKYPENILLFEVNDNRKVSSLCLCPWLCLVHVLVHAQVMFMFLRAFPSLFKCTAFHAYFPCVYNPSSHWLRLRSQRKHLNSNDYFFFCLKNQQITSSVNFMVNRRLFVLINPKMVINGSLSGLILTPSADFINRRYFLNVNCPALPVFYNLC